MSTLHNRPGFSDFANDWTRGFARAVANEAKDGKLDAAGAERISQRADATRIYGDNAQRFVDAFGGQAPAGAATNWGYQHVQGRLKSVAGKDGRITPNEAAKLPHDLRADYEVLTRQSLARYQGERLAGQFADVANGMVSPDFAQPYAPVSVNRNKKWKMDEAGLRSALGIDAKAQVELSDGRDFFSQIARDQKLPESTRDRFWALHKVMNRNTQDLKVVTVTGGEMSQLYVLGRTTNGDVAGLVSPRLFE